MLGDLNDWLNGSPLSNCHYYNKIEGNLIYATSFFLDLNQNNISIPIVHCLILYLKIDLCVSSSNYPIVAPDNYHPHFILILN
jgi:hypothetical protein